jgi:hypothetical protein
MKATTEARAARLTELGVRCQEIVWDRKSRTYHKCPRYGTCVTTQPYTRYCVQHARQH